MRPHKILYILIIFSSNSFQFLNYLVHMTYFLISAREGSYPFYSREKNKAQRDELAQRQIESEESAQIETGAVYIHRPYHFS